MQHTLIIEIVDVNAIKTLREMERGNLIRFHHPQNADKATPFPPNLKGAMAKASLSDIEEQLHELRSGWE